LEKQTVINFNLVSLAFFDAILSAFYQASAVAAILAFHNPMVMQTIEAPGKDFGNVALAHELMTNWLRT